MNKNATDQLNTIMNMSAIGDYLESNQVGLFNHPGMYAGVKVMEVPIVMTPKIQISKDFQHCTPEFRLKMDFWLLKRFGSRDETPIKPGEAMLFNGMALMRPEAAVMLRNCT